MTNTPTPTVEQLTKSAYVMALAPHVPQAARDLLTQLADALEEYSKMAMVETVRELRSERDAYRKAKAENDERFQLERDAARADQAAANGLAESYRKQLEMDCCQLAQAKKEQERLRSIYQQLHGRLPPGVYMELSKALAPAVEATSKSSKPCLHLSKAKDGTCFACGVKA